MIPLRNFTDSNWIFEDYRSKREMDFRIVALKGLPVEIHKFEGVEQPVVYEPDNVHAMPYYSSDANAANQLLQELPHAVVHAPHPNFGNLWRVAYEYNGVGSESNDFGANYCDAICKAWVSWKAWVNNVR